MPGNHYRSSDPLIPPQAGAGLIPGLPTPGLDKRQALSHLATANDYFTAIIQIQGIVLSSGSTRSTQVGRWAAEVESVGGLLLSKCRVPGTMQGAVLVPLGGLSCLPRRAWVWGTLSLLQGAQKSNDFQCEQVSQGKSSTDTTTYGHAHALQRPRLIWDISTPTGS